MKITRKLLAVLLCMAVIFSMGVDTAFAFDLPATYDREEVTGEAVLSGSEETDGPDIDGDAQGDPAFDVEESTPEEPVTEEDPTEENTPEPAGQDAVDTDATIPDVSGSRERETEVATQDVSILAKEDPANRDAVYTVGEIPVKGYTTVIDGFKITNTHKVIKAGDEMNPGLWIGILAAAVAAIVIIAILIFRKKK